ncbi:hypothetical protein ACRQ5Q_15035 [Bradyrhizobium sp. PMVTL-01]|uniref:hypothetical protein n=1 Tax=Bradyrhizobium sp. PMVTL-01 TaxID=3434999 RepID=UPI003F72B47D
MGDPKQCPHCDRVFQWGEDGDSHYGVAAAGPSCNKNAFWKLTGHLKADHPNAARHVCGRRFDMFRPPSGTEPEDFWHGRGAHRACSYCGSMNPDDFFKAVEDGSCAKITGTDKNYKIYVDVADAHVKLYFQHFDADQQQRFIDLYNEKKLPLEPRFGLYVWPFFAVPATSNG